ncbi:FCD domain-containing protein [Bradyrhizobium sp. 187]|uniref:FadR/GntR family transcriptional regulator n=1 Tax=Bradyrhizobium sp. 187 TaxID=2782655 RepID=UPI001FFFB0A6|nr:FCD domain-containing protein [Bradyrhizobium sp. 187]UPJ71830.1 FadR family transcriptional regulator [Bradyrhizobium sp. 187]
MSDEKIRENGQEPQLIDQLREWLLEVRLPEDGRFPPERELAGQFGVNRAEIRKGLAILEAEGLIWRRVGKGTFLTRNVLADSSFLHRIAPRVSPPEAMRARLILEPELARLAALHATTTQIEAMNELCGKIRFSKTWDEYEELDWLFHALIAEATNNTLLTELQRMVNGVRRMVVWGHLDRTGSGPAQNYHSFDEHDQIVKAISRRDRKGAAEAMKKHLDKTASQLLD